MVRDGLSEEEVVQPSPRWGEGVPALQAEGPPWAKAWSWETAQHVLETEQRLGVKRTTMTSPVPKTRTRPT